jgi:hypothetical protein
VVTVWLITFVVTPPPPPLMESSSLVVLVPLILLEVLADHQLDHECEREHTEDRGGYGWHRSEWVEVEV